MLNDMNFTNNGIGGTVGSCGDALGATTDGTFVTAAGCLSNVHLETVTTATLTRVTANDGDGHGISGYQVSSLTLTGISVERNGNEVGEDGVQLVNSSGTVTVSGTSTFRDNASNQFEAQNGSGVATFTHLRRVLRPDQLPDDWCCGSAESRVGTANSGLLISASSTANMTATVTGSTFDENYANGYLSDTAGGATMNITLGTAGSGNVFTNNGVPIEIVNASTGALTYVIRNNTITNATAITGIVRDHRHYRGAQRRRLDDDGHHRRQHHRHAGSDRFGLLRQRLRWDFTPDAATANTNVYHVTATNNQINHVHGGITSNIGGISGGMPRTSFVFTGNLIQNPAARHSGQRHCDQFRHAAGQRAADLRRDFRQHAEWRVERPQWRLDSLPPPRRRRLDVPRAQLRRRLGHRCLRDRHQHLRRRHRGRVRLPAGGPQRFHRRRDGVSAVTESPCTVSE